MPQYPQDLFATIDELQFHYRDWGGSGQQVVLLHGLASTCHIWDFVAPILAQDFAVVALDQRGHGESTKPDHGYDFASVSQDLGGFIQYLGLDEPIIAGHSWGGDVALEFAVANPKVAKGLCFVDGGMIEVSNNHGSLEQAREQMAPPIFTGFTVEKFLERVRNGNQAHIMNPQVEQVILANFEVLEDKTIRARLSRDNHIRIIEALWDHHPRKLYHQVQCPVLVLPARQLSNPALRDRSGRRTASVSAAIDSLPEGKAVWLEDSVHDVPLQRPKLVASLIKKHIQDGFFG